MRAGRIRPSGRNRQRGVALLTALLLMLAVLMTSIAAARTALSGARAAGHERDRMLALQGAMAALADAEHDIEGGLDPASARAAVLAHAATPATAGAFAVGCRGGTPYDGLCERAPDAADILAALADDDGPAVTLGTFTGMQVAAGEGGLPARAPRYLIERMPAPAGALLYRVSALGFGSIGTTQVAVQAYYRKLLAGAPPTGSGPAETAPQPVPAPDPGTEAAPGTASAPRPSPGPGTPGGPGIRVGWREIGNWHDTVASAGAAATGEGR